MGGSKTVALAGLFPFVGYLVIMNKEIFQYFTLITDASLLDPEKIRESVTIRMHQIYFALVWLSVGVLLYRTMCPLEISKFKDRYEFFEMELKISQPARLNSIKNGLPFTCVDTFFIPTSVLNDITSAQALDFNKLKVESTVAFPDVGDENKSFENWLNDSRISVSQLLNVYYDKHNFSRGGIRSITLICFAVGYVKLAWPSFEILWTLISTPVG